MAAGHRQHRSRLPEPPLRAGTGSSAGPGSPSPDLWSDLAAADVVVTHGGQNAVAEVAAARRPAVVVAQPRPFDEQVATAGAVDRLGAAVGLAAWPHAAAWPGLLEQALDRGGEGWRQWSTGHGAASPLPARCAGRATPAHGGGQGRVL